MSKDKDDSSSQPEVWWPPEDPHNSTPPVSYEDGKATQDDYGKTNPDWK